jgi:hypothetical protein
MQLLIMKFSSLIFYLVPLRPTFFPQHPILKHSQPTFLPQCQRPSFTPVQNNRQSYCSVYNTSIYSVLFKYLPLIRK